MNTMRDIPASGNAHGRDCWAGTEPAWYRPAPRDLSTAPAHVVCAMHLRWVDAGRPVWPVFPEIPARECVPGASRLATASLGKSPHMSVPRKSMPQ